MFSHVRRECANSAGFGEGFLHGLSTWQTRHFVTIRSVFKSRSWELRLSNMYCLSEVGTAAMGMRSRLGGHWTTTGVVTIVYLAILSVNDDNSDSTLLLMLGLIYLILCPTITESRSQLSGRIWCKASIRFCQFTTSGVFKRVMHEEYIHV